MTRRALPWLIASTTVLLAITGLAIQLRFPPAREYTVGDKQGPFTAAFVGCGVLGALLSIRRGPQPLAWLLSVIGLSWGVHLSTLSYGALATLGPGRLPGGPIAAWIANQTLIVCVVLTATWLLLLFPNGRFLSPRWRPVGGLASVALGLIVAQSTVTPGRLGPASYVDNPFGLPEGSFGALGAAWPLLAMSILLSAASLGLRLRRSRGVEREQLKWFTYASGVLAVAFAIGFVTDFHFGTDQLLAGALVFMPVAIAFAIFRYRLYDIDVLIRRTLIYAALSAVLAAAYVGAVALFETLLAPFIAGNGIAVAVSTLTVVALIQPLRRRMQALVDRRFYRSQYNAARTLDAFSGRLRDEIDLDAVRAELVSAVRDTVQPAQVSVWIR